MKKIANQFLRSELKEANSLERTPFTVFQLKLPREIWPCYFANEIRGYLG